MKYVDISKFNVDDDSKFFRVELISREGELQPQVITLNSKKEGKAIDLETKITKLLSGEKDVEIYALLNILKKKMSDE